MQLYLRRRVSLAACVLAITATAVWALLACHWLLADACAGLGRARQLERQPRFLDRVEGLSQQHAFAFPHARFDPSCPRYAYVRLRQGAGAGHHFGDIALGISFARRLGATFVLPEMETFNANHGANYTGLYDFLNMRAGEHLLEDVRRQNPALQVIDTTWNDTTWAPGCNLLISAQDASCTGFPALPNEFTWCFYSEPHILESVKHAMRVKFAAAPASTRDPARLTAFSGGSTVTGPDPSGAVAIAAVTAALADQDSQFHVAWHIRVGDVSFNSNNVAYFTAVAAAVRDAVSGVTASGIPVRHTIFSNWVADDQAPPGFEMLASLLAPAPVRFVGRSLPMEATLYHFIHADMVVETGSSFTAIARTVSDGPVFITACHHGDYCFARAFDTTEEFRLNGTGSLVDSAVELKSAAERRAKKRLAKWKAG